MFLNMSDREQRKFRLRVIARIREVNLNRRGMIIKPIQQTTYSVRDDCLVVYLCQIASVFLKFPCRLSSFFSVLDASIYAREIQRDSDI